MEKMFAFGENWKAFSNTLTEGQFETAKRSMSDLVGDLSGRSVIDIGCGSGLFSIAALSLGARLVIGIDLDPVCIETSRKNLRRFGNAVPARWDSIMFKTGSILEWSDYTGSYDVVYSWGVLHHTGDMYKACTQAARLVADGGLLVLAIYNKHFTSPIWKWIKKTYVHSPYIIKALMIAFFCPVNFLAKLFLMRKNPFNTRRGMSFFYDVIDWVGGYPYEYASTAEMTSFIEKLGFKTEKVIKTEGFTGCNEFVFRKI